MKNIILASGIIDFYVDKEKYNSYKSLSGKWNFVHKTLSTYLKQMNDKIILWHRVPDEIKIRDVSFTSNNFWGQDEFCIINDLGYSGTNKLPLNKDKLTIRFFHVDVVATSDCDDALNHFFTIDNKNFKYQTSSVKLV